MQWRGGRLPREKSDIEATNFDFQGRYGPVRETNTEIFQTSLFERETRGLVEEAIERRDIETEVLSSYSGVDKA